MLVDFILLTAYDRDNGQMQLEEYNHRSTLSITTADYRALCSDRLFRYVFTPKTLRVEGPMPDADLVPQFNYVVRWQAQDLTRPEIQYVYGWDLLSPVSAVYSMGCRVPLEPSGLSMIFTPEQLDAQGLLDPAYMRPEPLSAAGQRAPVLFAVSLRRYQDFVRFHRFSTIENVPAPSFERLPIEYWCVHCGAVQPEEPIPAEPCPVRPGPCEWRNRLK
jgi:hypothetical protein